MARRPETDPTWLTVFLDLPAETHERATAFWRDVTGYAVSPPRGEHGEFASLVPEDGDAHLRVQRLADGPARLHLDLHVTDPRAAADVAVGAGATEVADLGHVLLTSPGGLPFCLVSHPAARVAPVPTWPGGHTAGVYQVCLDVPGEVWDVETAFWAHLLRAEVDSLTRRPEFAWLRPAPAALDVLLQRLDDPSGPVRAHLDCGSGDRPAEVARHRALGAEVEVVEDFWTVLVDPAGLRYCITDRDPATRLLAT